MSNPGPSRNPAVPEDWSPLHDLALIYLVLAHGTDEELSKSEVEVMLRKLQGWLPDVPAAHIREILRSAMNRYVEGGDQTLLHRAIISVRDSMLEEQKMLAFRDLVQLANADGVFLDVEEDLINLIMEEWRIGPMSRLARSDPDDEEKSDA